MSLPPGFEALLAEPPDVSDLLRSVTVDGTLPADASEAARAALGGARSALGRTEPDDACPICMCGFDAEAQPVELSRCAGEHYFHFDCAVAAFAHSSRCAVCGFWYAPNEGAMPPGTMEVGAAGGGFIAIRYAFANGTQGPEHPSPGQPFRGTSRTAYLPDTEEGREVLELLRRAFAQRLTFAVGTSVTTGRRDCVVWNGIHHKTRVAGGPANYGYPDETYLRRVKEELAAKGVVPPPEIDLDDL